MGAFFGAVVAAIIIAFTLDEITQELKRIANALEDRDENEDEDDDDKPS